MEAAAGRLAHGDKSTGLLEGTTTTGKSHFGTMSKYSLSYTFSQVPEVPYSPSQHFNCLFCNHAIATMVNVVRVRPNHVRTRSKTNDYEFDPWTCPITVALYQNEYPYRSIRDSFLQIYPAVLPHVTLLDEYNVPPWVLALPIVSSPTIWWRANPFDISVNDAVLENESQYVRLTHT